MHSFTNGMRWYVKRLLVSSHELQLTTTTTDLGDTTTTSSTTNTTTTHVVRKKAGGAMARTSAREAVNHFADKTSMHGVPSLVKARTPRARCFWSLVCIIAMGMFISMLISLVIKYFSFPVIVKVDQIPNAMVRPRLSFCNQRHINILNTTAITQLFSGRHDLSQIEPDEQNQAVNYFYHLLKSLNKLRSILDKYKVYKHMPSAITTMTGKIHKINQAKSNQTTRGSSSSTSSSVEEQLLVKWSQLTDQLTVRPLLTTLLPQAYLAALAPTSEEFLIHCQKMGMKCVLDTNQTDHSWLHSDFFRCFTYDVMKGQEMDEATSQGISNGITFVFMAGSGMIASKISEDDMNDAERGEREYNQDSSANEDINNEVQDLWNIPGLDNTFEPGAGSDGIRLNVHEPGTVPNPSFEGLDIPPGVSAVIGISSKNIKRLPYPYSNCSNENMELHLLTEEIKKDYKDSSERKEVVERSHRQIDCQSACLQRHVWTKCKCLDITLTLPFFERELLCGYSDQIEALTFPRKYNKQHCFSAENMTSLKECRELFGKLLGDLECLKHVKNWHQTHNSTEPYSCRCPPSCHSISYDLDYGTSKWPGSGPELDSAYDKIVKAKIIPYFQRLNSSLAEEQLRYFSQRENRQEIMKNFVRLTLYIKDLTVHTTQQVEAYSALDLISDMGGQLGLWVGISVITLCEIIALFSQLLHHMLRCCRDAGRRKTMQVNHNDIYRSEEQQALNADTKV